jgi:hypothetical protein
MQPIKSPYQQFVFKKYSFDQATGQAEFVYRLDAIEFVERVNFPVSLIDDLDHSTLDRALFALHLIGGISYYKAGLLPEIIVESGSLSEAAATFWNKLYTLGLGEFFYRNDLDFRDYIHFPFVHNRADQFAAATRPQSLSGALLPIGGGKDSLVAVELLRQAGIDFDLLVLGDHERIEEVITAVEERVWRIERQIDPKLFALNKAGAWNGHVPISAYIALASVVTAVLTGKRDIVLANERSANIGNLKVGDVEINHQYSKSLEFEQDFQHYVAEEISSEIRYFSLLRQLSELAIAKKFVEQGKYFDVFSSCNKNFKQSGERPEHRWCGDCAKCAFVFAMFAAWLSRTQLEKIFGSIFFDHESLLETYRDLLGCGVNKPFDCVGEPDEMMVALELARRRGDLDNTLVMKWFAEEVLPAQDDLDNQIEMVLKPSPQHAMPEEYAKLIYEN